MWVVKCRGESYYVNHVSCSLPWSTKETPSNSHTKGSIKIKECLLTIDTENSATISELTMTDRIRLKNRDRGITRIIFGGTSGLALPRAFQEDGIRHSPFRRIAAGCGSTWTVCDILRQSDMTLLALKYPNTFRVLKPNETYYQAYDSREEWDRLAAEADSEIYGLDDYSADDDEEDD